MERDKSLLDKNSFGFDVKARLYYEFREVYELETILDEVKGEEICLLGGGNNILFTKDYNGAVIHPINDEIEVIAEYKDYVLVRAMAGGDWDNFVEYTIYNGFYGAENLSAIPSSIGAVAVQNIGAYGSEAKDIIEGVEYYDTVDRCEKTIDNNSCHFGYRDSIFKHELKERAIVTAIIFRLSKRFTPNLKYKDLSFTEEEVTAQMVRDRVVAIRSSKLPDTKIVGNGGSFFKNPVIERDHFERLLLLYPDMPSYPDRDGVKIPAAWLIDKSGWKGYRSGQVGVHDNQPLVLVHFGGGAGSEICELSQQIIEDIYKKYGISLSPEVIII